MDGRPWSPNGDTRLLRTRRSRGLRVGVPRVAGDDGKKKLVWEVHVHEHEHEHEHKHGRDDPRDADADAVAAAAAAAAAAHGKSRRSLLLLQAHCKY